MPPKSDAQKQVSKERLLATLKGFGTGYAGGAGFMNPMFELIYQSSKDDPNPQLGRREKNIMQNMFRGVGLLLGSYNAYGEYKKSSPFSKRC